MHIIIAGATGLTGSLIVDRLLAHADDVRITGLLRRPSGRNHPRWREHVGPASEWPAVAAGLDADIAISALGTTMRQAGSRTAFEAVDLVSVRDFAAAARRGGVRQMIAVSSVGADPLSRNFYLATKGRMEEELEALAFDRLDIFQPGLLRGTRGGRIRPAERLAILLSPVLNALLRGPLARYAAIDAASVATAIVAVTGAGNPGIFRHENPAIRALAGE